MKGSSAFFGLATLVLVGCNREEPILNRKPDVESCRREPGMLSLSIDSWEKGALDVRLHFLPSGTTPCPARKFPFLDVSAKSNQNPGGELRFIQIIEVNEPIPGGKRHTPSWQIIAEDEPWMFVDMVEELRDGGEPFLNGSRDGTFWDNPAWPDPPKEGQKGGARTWQSRTYAVSSQGRAVKAIAGFTWGWKWTVGAKGPEAVAPVQLARSIWEEDARRLSSVYAGWSFH